MSAIDYVIHATKSDCYKVGEKMTPKGILVHSTGCNNPNLKRYVQPDNGYIGVNPYANDNNRPGVDVCVHAWIGKDKNGNVKTCQTLPFNYCCWGCYKGHKGSYNNNPPYIQFEMCEDGLKDKAYCTAVYNKAVELCVHLCKTFNISVDNIVSHHEAGQQGYASEHVDPDNWWKNHGYTMDKFRAAVKSKLGTTPTNTSTTASGAKKLYRVRKTWSDYNSQIGAYSSLDNAKKACKTGYSVFDWNGIAVYRASAPAKKSIDEIAKEVINGKWGNGADRKKRLTDAGYDYNAVQKRVNEIL